MIRVLIVDQFSGVSPYELQQHPMPFEDLIKWALSRPAPAFGHKAEVKEVPEDFQAKFCTTVVKANALGMAEAWRWKWDSSG